MGLALRYNLFYTPSAGAVVGALKRHYAELGARVQTRPFPRVDSRYGAADTLNLEVYTNDHGWVIVDLPTGWDLTARREAQASASQQLQCAGLLVFVYDGDVWGYDLFSDGRSVDHFIQDPEYAAQFFPGVSDTSGHAFRFEEVLPFVSAADVRPYLVRAPAPTIDGDAEFADCFRERERLDVPPRPGDKYSRFHECAVLDFLRVLRVDTVIRNQHVVREAEFHTALVVTPRAPA